MQKLLAQTISLVFHPIIMPPLGLLIMFNTISFFDLFNYQQKQAIFLIILTGTSLLPLSLLPVLIMQKLASGFDLKYHRERVLPLLVTTGFYIFTWFILARINVPGIIATYIITAALAVFTCGVISIKWKISLHMTAIGALAGLVLAIAFRFSINLQLYLTIVFLAGGATGWARLTLRAHTPAEVYSGYLLGVAVAYIAMSYF